MLFASVDAAGRIFPLLPVADAARRAGHDVLFATGDALFPLLDRAGFARTRAGMGHQRAFERARESLRDPDRTLSEQMPEMGVAVFGDIVPRAMFATTGSVIERYRPDLVIAEIGSPGAWFAAEYHGVPSRGVTWGPVVQTPTTSRAAERTAKVAADLGVSGFVPYLDICPGSLQSPSFRDGVERTPMRSTTFAFPDDVLPSVATDPARDRPLVYMTISSAADTVDTALLRDIATGLARLPVEVLMTTGVASDELGELPANVHVQRWVPQGQLMRHVALAVHHGGPGAMMNALAAGVPQLVLPDSHGVEPGTSDVVEASGSGAVLRQDDVTPDLVHGLASELLTGTAARSVATALAAEIAAMPSVDDVLAQVVESLEER